MSQDDAQNMHDQAKFSQYYERNCVRPQDLHGKVTTQNAKVYQYKKYFKMPYNTHYCSTNKHGGEGM